MVCQIPNKTQNSQAVNKQINVSNLTPLERQKLFIECINQSGFIGFMKKEIDNQTYYTFTYVER
jgi:hypothetical protein